MSAPDGHENPNHGTRTPPNLCLAGSAAVEATTAIVVVTASRFVSSVEKKALFGNPTRAFFGAWKGALRIASRRSWKVSACSPRRRWQARRRSATGQRAATAMPSAARS
ncbi:MAG: hypothetical protein F4X99_22365 [Gammaproteobacteria bacterium]|nr:hypothetical protein [Gammaproteobacteria bacterium]